MSGRERMLGIRGGDALPGVLFDQPRSTLHLGWIDQQWLFPLPVGAPGPANGFVRQPGRGQASWACAPTLRRAEHVALANQGKGQGTGDIAPSTVHDGGPGMICWSP